MDGQFWKWMHFVGIFIVIGIWILAIPTGWIQSVTFVSHISMAALVLAEISSWQGSRTEQKQDAEIEDTIDDRDDIERK